MASGIGTARDIPLEIGQGLAAARKKKRLSQEDVAAKAGVSLSRVSTLERGNQTIKGVQGLPRTYADILARIVDALELDVVDVLGRAGFTAREIEQAVAMLPDKTPTVDLSGLTAAQLAQVAAYVEGLKANRS